MKSINELCKDANDNAVDHGFVDQTFGERIALIHSELSEALEEYRKGEPIAAVSFRQYVEPSFKDSKIYNKPEGIPIELADAVIRIFDLCGEYEIDLEHAITIKMQYNKTRPFKHGDKII